jgi:hypothetical protein
MQTLHVFSSSSASSSAPFSLVAALVEEDDVEVVEGEVEVDGTGASDFCFAVPPEAAGAGFLPPA